MRIILSVAGGAICGCALEISRCMAACAGNGGMFAIEMEGKFRVIHLGGFPAIRHMTSSALIAKRTFMCIILRVAGSAVHGRAFEDAVNMTTRAGDSGVLAIQMECKLRVVHRRRFPALRRMAGRALRAELTLMSVITLMAGETILRRAFEDTIDMTTLAGDCGMFAIQLECELGMIHLRQIPAFRRVTGCAVGSKLTVVMVIFQMAGCARLRGGFQVVEVMCIRMTGRTFHRRMFADQVERHLVMVKVCSKRFHAIVTGHAVCSEGQEVFRGECLVNLQMAVTTGRLIERASISLYVAVFTGKCRTVCLCLVSSQFE